MADRREYGSGAKVRVAILGGGIAGLTTAYELSHPRQKGKFAVSLYQLGWRLGGKCASGRDPVDKRVKEHGPHVLFNFYDNSFEMMDEVYASLPPEERLAPTFRDALKPTNSVFVMQKKGPPPPTWVQWAPFGSPRGEGPGRSDIPGPNETLALAASQVEAWLDQASDELHGFEGRFDDAVSYAREAAVAARSLPQRPTRMQVDSVASPLRRARAIGKQVYIQYTTPAEPMGGGLGEIHQPRPPGVFEDEKPGLRLIILADLAATLAAGALEDGLLLGLTRQNVDAANELDYRDWLKKHGASEFVLNSALVRAVYGTVFGYVGGHLVDPKVEAGSVVLTQLAMVRPGPLAWKMRSGTGDVTAAPLYKALRQQGVDVHFFHKVEKLVPSGDGTQIQEIRILRQVALKKNGAGTTDEYDPFIQSMGHDVWPDRPNFDQVEDGESIGKADDLESHWAAPDGREQAATLLAGEDFDAVVLAIGLGALPSICSELAGVDRRWRDLFDNVKTVETGGAHIWLRAPKEKHKDDWSFNVNPVVTGYDLTEFNTWLDASEVIDTEEWPGKKPEERPVKLAILCGPRRTWDPMLPAHDWRYPDAAIEEQKRAYSHFIEQAPALWKSYAGATDAMDKLRIMRVDYVAGINPSDRYVQSLPGTGKYRIRPDASGFGNLLLAGDWTDYGWNLGCFEGAVISGRLAANALGGVTRPVKHLVPDPIGQWPSPGIGRWVENAASQTLPAAVDFRDVDLRLFAVKADRDRVRELCHRFFAAPSRGRVSFEPLAPDLVAFSFADIPMARAIGNEHLGYAIERELAVVIPGVFRAKDANGAHLAAGPAVFMPYLFIDNPATMLTGWEVHGFFKQLAELRYPGDGDYDGFEVTVHGLPRFDPSKNWGATNLLTMEPFAKAEDVELPPVLGPVLKFLERAGNTAVSQVLTAASGLVGGSVRQLFLKQFREIDRTDRAAYQAITMAGYDVSRIHRVSVTGQYRLAMPALESTPLTAELGIVTPAIIGPGLRVRFDMRLGLGRVLWKA